MIPAQRRPTSAKVHRGFLKSTATQSADAIFVKRNNFNLPRFSARPREALGALGVQLSASHPGPGSDWRKTRLVAHQGLMLWRDVRRMRPGGEGACVTTLLEMPFGAQR